MVAHNHPFGDPAPSAANIQITRVLPEAAKVIDIELMDHAIIGDPKSDSLNIGYYSFRAAGIL